MHFDERGCGSAKALMDTTLAWLCSFEALKAELGSVEHWLLQNVYADESVEGRTSGFRATHSTGFVLDVLWVNSAPQALLWVNTPLDSDRGEAHTCEHVLLGKGRRGRDVSSREALCLAISTAFTGRLRTCYTFQCPGRDSFFTLLGAKLAALLAPDASEIEVRREVCHFGLLGGNDVDELGTVYSEQRAAFQQANYVCYHALNRLLYGRHHPLAHEAGGTPQGIRASCPEHVRAFHNTRYVLGAMGAVVALAPCCPSELLLRLHDCLVAARDTPRPWLSDGGEATTAAPAMELEERWLPPAEPAPPGTVQTVRVPLGDATAPGQLVAAWPCVMPHVEGPEASIALSMLQLLVSLIAGGRTSELHGVLVTAGGLGATSVSGYVSSEPGRAVFITLDGMPRAAEGATQSYTVACEAMRAAFEKVANFADGSPELKAFNARALSHLATMERGSRQFLSAPPRFGVRGVHAEWLDHLCDAQRCAKPGATTIFLSFVGEASALRCALRSSKNEWAPHIASWGLAARLPVAVATQACDVFAAQLERERADRLQTFYDELVAAEPDGDSDDRRAAGLARFRRAYDADTEATKVDIPTFDPPSDLPMTEDDSLDTSQLVLPGGGCLLAARFIGMTGCHAGVALSLVGLPPRFLRVLVGLAPLLKSVGVTPRRGGFVEYRELCSRLQNEVLYLDARLSANRSSGRLELVMRTAGLNIEEALAGLDWLEALLSAPDLTVRALERFREAVDEAYSAARSLTERRAEFWQDSVAASCLETVGAPYLLVENHAARTHALHRLRWRLQDVPAFPSAAASCLHSLLLLPSHGQTRASLEGALAAAENGALQAENGVLRQSFGSVPSSVQTLLRSACASLRTLLAGVPDTSFARDWATLCAELIKDVLDPPEAVLSELSELLRFARRRGRARAFLAAGPDKQSQLCAALRALVARLPADASVQHGASASAVALRRAALRGAAIHGTSPPPCIALVLPRLSVGGVVCMTACASAQMTDQDMLLDALAAQTVAGGGAHSLFMRLWSTGLAYSCGISVSLSDGRLRFYADTCPDVAKCIMAAAAEVAQDARAPAEPGRADYAIAQCFTSRAGTSTPEARTEAAASDEADGRGAERVRALRSALLRLRHVALGGELHARAPRVLGALLPGVLSQPWAPTGWTGSQSASGSTMVVVGPEVQAAGVEAILQFPILRLYERDFWVVVDDDSRSRATLKRDRSYIIWAGAAVAFCSAALALI